MQPILIDLDGVLRLGKIVLPGIELFLETLNKIKNPKIILSNSTLNSKIDLLDFFESKNIDINIPLITAADASLEYLRKHYSRAAVYAVDKVKILFKEFLDYENPEVVLIGDLDKEWNYEIMNEIFRFVNDGKDFIAMQKNKYWTTPEDGLLLDAGAFIKGIEFAAEKEAILIGKPSPEYFKLALNKIGCSKKNKFLMIGDDVLNDIKGAKVLGAETILIYTGKTKFPINAEERKFTDHEVFNLTELSNLLLEKFG